MKTSEFKKILKPLIKQTIREVLIEDGMLSKVVSEVARGLNAPILERKTPRKDPIKEGRNKQEAEELYETQRQDRIRRLNESAGMSADIFSGTKEIPQESSGYAPLAGSPPADKGVDITAIEELAAGKWKNLI